MPNSIPARNRIISSFWKLLSKHNYSDITIKSIAIDAKVNHNTIYYHFKNIDEIALTALDDVIIDDLPELFLSILSDVDKKINYENFLIEKGLLDTFMKIRLFARGDSIFLYNNIKNIMLEKWLLAINVDLNYLEEEDLVDLEFIFNGITSLVANPIIEKDPKILTTIVNRPLGHGIIATINRLKEKYN
ncbi:TetR/AcrR family transcriptional regulator [Peptostreptococcus equinus]|uniref:TetR/AcrR family transcriptional regulator n=1 Tax=Peptostreptococcus equinus TaxID=3003601 RepID=A0ABY7JMD0_9FIRM|nr:TetR/AcrR family transcriptional regulator [Peptostreptococcus sp. CBA3647]WAW14518.1 TetR/AcrR family transcriptional regulator [Peptostreptococcus sp. CBA3647]